MTKQPIYLYSSAYNGLDKDCEEYKLLRIEYIKKYLKAIIDDNFWMEKHYLSKILTCISYNNFSENINQRLYKVFFQRVQYLSYYLLLFCEDIKNDETLEDDFQKSVRLRSVEYSFTTNSKQQYPYYHSLYKDLTNLFQLYKNNKISCFVTDEDLDRYNDCRFLFKYSHMEQEMANTFKKMNIELHSQKKFSDLLSPLGVSLRFDGCISKNGQTLLFECQGLQHYKVISFFGGEEGFKKRQLYDQIKKDWCKEHNIPLLCIRYNQNVQSTIKRFLKRKNYSDIIYEYK